MLTATTLRTSPLTGAVVAITCSLLLIPTVVAQDMCFQSSNVMRLHAFAIVLVLILAVLAFGLSVQTIRQRSGPRLIAVLTAIVSAGLFVYGLAAAQLAVSGACLV